MSYVKNAVDRSMMLMRRLASCDPKIDTSKIVPYAWDDHEEACEVYIRGEYDLEEGEDISGIYTADIVYGPYMVSAWCPALMEEREASESARYKLEVKGVQAISLRVTYHDRISDACAYLASMGSGFEGYITDTLADGAPRARVGHRLSPRAEQDAYARACQLFDSTLPLQQVQDAIL